MTKLTWGDFGTRYYEAGTDRGVLYIPGRAGVPWNGLKAVKESPSGAEARPYYLDGYKYLNLASAEDFQATIEAFSSPPEFAECDGVGSISNGLSITQQPRKSFGLSYRTLVGNDGDGLDHGYKIHLVYNALAGTSSKDYASLGSSVSPVSLSWSITTQPPMISGVRPSAHFVIDSTSTPAYILELLEEKLYGTDSTSPYLPSVNEIVELFNNYATLGLLRKIGYNQFVLDQVPTVISPTEPVMDSGESILWLDTSNPEYARIYQVTGA